MATPSRIDPEALLRSHFAREIDEEKARSRPLPRDAAGAPSNGRGRKSQWLRGGAFLPEAAAATLLLVSLGTGILAPRGIAGAEILEKTIVGERGALVGRAISLGFSSALRAFSEGKKPDDAGEGMRTSREQN